MTLPDARTLGRRYALGEPLGSGGMAEVFRARDTRLDRDVAVKVLRPDLARDPVKRQRFRREAQSSARLNAPCIVSVYDTGEDTVDGTTGVPWIVMEHVQGRTLREVLQQEGPLLPRRALEVVADVCSALEVAHEAGIVHRDIKPGNVMLTPGGDVKVMDFGIARAAEPGSATATQTSDVIGTAAYLSPEQARGEHADTRSDLYSTGCLLYELLTGRPPFTGDSPVAVAYQHVREDPALPSQHDSALPPALDAVVLKAMAKNPANRYQSAALMRADLLRAAEGQPVEATPVLMEAATVVPRGSTRLADPVDRRRGLVYGLFGVLLLAVLLGTALLVRGLIGDDTGLVDAPPVVGLSQEDAQIRLADAGLLVGQVDQVFNADKPLGTVLSQSPVAGIAVEQGGRINLVVSLGVKMAIVPEVVGQSQDEARAQLRAVELGVKEVVLQGGNIAPGQVLDVLPAAGTQLPTGDGVTLVVASGQIDVPSVVGRPQAEAEQALTSAGFNVGVRFRADDGPVGVVLQQSPSTGTARRGSTVTIVVSEVPPPPPTPEPAPTTLPPVTPSPTPSPRPTATPSPSTTSPTPSPSA